MKQWDAFSIVEKNQIILSEYNTVPPTRLEKLSERIVLLLRKDKNRFEWKRPNERLPNLTMWQSGGGMLWIMTQTLNRMLMNICGTGTMKVFTRRSLFLQRFLSFSLLMLNKTHKVRNTCIHVSITLFFN